MLTRSGCHLCEQAQDALQRLSAELGFALNSRDVDADAELQDEYGDRVPVILIDGREHGYWRLEVICEDLHKRVAFRLVPALPQARPGSERGPAVRTCHTVRHHLSRGR